MKSLGLLLLLLIAGSLHRAHAQQPIICNDLTAAVCSTSVNPGDGTLGDPAWIAFGKVNANFAALPPQLFAGLALPISYGGTGQTTAIGAINALLPSQTASAGDCLGTNGTIPSWVTCGSGGGLTSVGLTVPGFLTVTGSPLTSNGTLAVSYSGTALPVANGGTGQTTTSAAINALLPSQTGMSGNCLGTNGSVTSWVTCGTGGSGAFSALTGGTNTSAAMLVGTGSSLGPTGSGTVTANAVVSGTALGTPTSIVLTNGSGLPLTTGVTGILPVANGGTGTASPGLVGGTNVTVTGTWPNQTITASSTAATAFSALTGATNTSAAMLVGTGASLATTGTGTITASSLGALTGMPSQAAGTVIANTTGSSGAPTAVSLASFQTAMIAANAQLVTDSPAAGPIVAYNPSGFGATTAILYLTPASGGTTLDSLVAGSAMQQVFIINAEAAGGSDLIKLVNQSSADSTAANRFMTSATSSLAIPPGGGLDCIYLASTIDRWWCH